MQLQSSLQHEQNFVDNQVPTIDKRQVLKAFNDHFVEFFEDVQRVFPENTDITSAKNAIVSIRKFNPRLLVMVFHNSVGEMYRNEIESGNLSYFTRRDYSREVGFANNADVLMEKINLLRDPVENMSTADQDSVVKYLNNLIALSDMYYGKV